MIETKIEKALDSYFESVPDDKFKQDLTNAGFVFYECRTNNLKGKYNRQNRYHFSVLDGLYTFYVGDAI